MISKLDLIGVQRCNGGLSWGVVAPYVDRLAAVDGMRRLRALA